MIGANRGTPPSTAPPSIARRSSALNGRDLEFRAIAEPMTVRDDGERPLGQAWTFGYVAESAEPADRLRPVVFAFNGGPGCSSIWLHLSGLGPWRALVPDELSAPVPAEPIGESEHSILDAADLVFIDPVETGFGRLAEGVDRSQISGADRDASITAQIIRDWLHRHDRLTSPVYLLGESYGTIRAALTATALREQDGPVVAGLVLLGQCLNAQETTQRPGNAAGYIAALPLLAAVAWYHGRSAHTASSLDDVVHSAHEFAVGEYAGALASGVVPEQVVRALVGFTGLTAGRLQERRYRIDKEEYRRLLLGDERQVLGLTDARYTLPATATGALEPETDAAGIRIDPVFQSAARTLLSELVGLEEVAGGTARYRFAGGAHEHWDYLEAAARNRFGGSGLPSPFAVFDYPAHLSAALRVNPAARVFFGTGHYDTLTTVGSLEHLKAQYGLPPERIVDRRYPAGHMFYTDPQSLRAFGGDLREFFTGGLRGD